VAFFHASLHSNRLIPFYFGHRFRSIPESHSGPFRTLIPIGSKTVRIQSETLSELRRNPCPTRPGIRTFDHEKFLAQVQGLEFRFHGFDHGQSHLQPDVGAPWNTAPWVTMCPIPRNSPLAAWKDITATEPTSPHIPCWIRIAIRARLRSRSLVYSA